MGGISKVTFALGTFCQKIQKEGDYRLITFIVELNRMILYQTILLKIVMNLQLI